MLEFLKSDYCAPLTEPAKRTFKRPVAFVRVCAEETRKEWAKNADSFGTQRFLRTFFSADTCIGECSRLGITVGGIFGAGINSVSGPTFAAGLVVGGVAGPFITPVAIALIVLAVSAVWGIPTGLIDGTIKAVSHFRHRNNPPALPALPPAVPLSPMSQNIVSQLAALPPEQRQTFLKACKEKFRDDFTAIRPPISVALTEDLRTKKLKLKLPGRK